MPIYCKYLLKSFFKVFFLCITGFIGLLLITRLKEIANFATMASNTSSVFLFVLFQIPMILMIAVPISAFIASLLLFQKISKTHELTALRAGGLSLFQICKPILWTGVILSFTNFLICSEIRPRSYFISRDIIFDQSTANPISLLEKKQFLKLKNTYLDAKLSSDKLHAKDLLMIFYHKANKRLGMLCAKKLYVNKQVLSGEQLCLLTQMENPEGFDTLIIENQNKMVTSASQISQYLKPSSWSLQPYCLPLRMYLAKMKIEKELKNTPDSILMEIFRRVCWGVSVFSFTLLGVAYGVEFTRITGRKKLFYALIFVGGILLSFIFAKQIHKAPLLSVAILCFFQVIAIYFSIRELKKCTRGIS